MWSFRSIRGIIANYRERNYKENIPINMTLNSASDQAVRSEVRMVHELLERAARGDELAAQAFQHSGELLGIALANLVCEYVQHLSIFDYISVSASLDSRMIEYSAYLHAHYLPPQAPGYSATMLPESIATYTYPTGAACAGATGDAG